MGNTCAKKNWEPRPRKDGLQPVKGNVNVLICTLDYDGYPASENGMGVLTASTDGTRFLDCVKSSGVPDEQIMILKDSPENAGTAKWPNSKNLWAALKTMGKKTKPDDCFLFFFGGHGYHQEETGCFRDEEDGQDEFLVLTNSFEKGEIDPFLDDTMKSMFMSYFSRDCKILMVTDCCHSGTVCDLDDPVLGGHQIVHYAAVQDTQEAADVGGGAFTVSLLEVLEDACNEGETVSVADLYERINSSFGPKWEHMNQNFNYTATTCADPDTFPWPVMPEEGWNVTTLID